MFIVLKKYNVHQGQSLVYTPEKHSVTDNSIIRLSDITDPRLRVYTDLSEIQLKTLYEPEAGVFIAESAKVIERALAAGYEAVSLLADEAMLTDEYAHIFRECPIIYTAPFASLCRLSGVNFTGGMLCCMRRKPLPEAKDLCANARRTAVLERVMNPTNIGAIIRSAAAMDIDTVLLTKDCCDPLYRRAIRVSMGTVFQIPWTFIDNALDVKKLGFSTAAMALTDKTIDISDETLKHEERLAIILGSEGDGLRSETISGSDYVVKIPMRETVDSLNVAAASAVAFWEIKEH